MTDLLKYHDCDRQDSWWEYDGRGIELCRVCEKCRSAKLAGYRPEILEPYSELDVNEPIEPDQEVY